MVMKKLYTILLITLTTVVGMAQFPTGGGTEGTCEISGVVIDGATGTPMEFATVALLRGSKERTTDGAVTDDKGRFRIRKIKKGTYNLEIGFLGYETLKLGPYELKEDDLKIKIDEVVLSPLTQALDEVVVTADEVLVESRIDKLIYNAEKDLTNRGGNAGDVLRKVPGVTVDLDGNVSLRGSRQIRVLINDKPSSIMARSVAEAMRMIPADNIEKVEVITSPSARYDGEGTAGIINIITKKKRVEGISGMAYGSFGNLQNALGTSLNFRVGDFGVNTNIGGYLFNMKGDYELNTEYFGDSFDASLKQLGTTKMYGKGLFGQVGIDYDFNSKNNLNVNFRLNDSKMNNRNNLDFYGATLGNDFQELFKNNALTTNDRLGLDINANYSRKFSKEKQKFYASVQYSPDNSNNYYNRDQLTFAEEPLYFEKSDNKGVNGELTFQVDYEHPITKSIQFETGAKSILRDIDSDYDYFFRSDYSSDFEFDPSRSNNFQYGQDVAAGYALVSMFLKNKWGIKAGARYEHTFIDGVFNEQNQTISNDYGNFLPSATVSYNFKNGTSMKVSYNQRISRPGMFHLNPFSNEADPLNVTQGNPNLIAERSNNYEVGYNWFKGMNSAQVGLYHRRTVDGIETIREVVDESALLTTYKNIGQKETTGLSLSGMYNNAMKQIVSLNLNVYYFDASSQENPNLSFDGIAYNMSGYAAIDIKNGYGIQVFGLINGPTISFQGRTDSWFYYNLSAKKDFKQKKGSITLGLDNFLTPKIGVSSKISDANFVNTSLFRYNSFGVRLGFYYQFGTMKFTNSKGKSIKNDDLKSGEQQGGAVPMGGGM